MAQKDALDAGKEDKSRGSSTTGAGSTPRNESPALLRRQGGRRLSRQNSGGDAAGSDPGRAGRSFYKNQQEKTVARRTLSKIREEPVALLFLMDFKGVTFRLMTKDLHFAAVEAKNLEVQFKMTFSHKFILAKLRNFKIYDNSENTLYRMIAESTAGEEVFNTQVRLYDTITDKDKSMGMPDVQVDAQLGQLRFVYLHKFINDFLLFIDPFTDTKEFIIEQTMEATKLATELAAEAYKDATRVKLNISMNAPVIILPRSSRSNLTFEANLGKFELKNHHHSQARIQYSNLF